MHVKVNGAEFDAVVHTRPDDSAWNGRESKAITFAGTYEEAIALFSNDVQWSVISENVDETGQTVQSETDLSEFALAGPVTDNRNGTVTVKMGRYLQSEIIALTIGQMPKTQAEVSGVRSAIETAVQSLDDTAAASVVSLFPTLKGDGSLIKAGTRINWYGKIIRAAVDLWDREDHSPERAPNLWEGL